MFDKPLPIPRSFLQGSLGTVFPKRENCNSNLAGSIDINRDNKNSFEVRKSEKVAI